MAASLDQFSPHVLAGAVVRAGLDRHLELMLPTEVEEVAAERPRVGLREREVAEHPPEGRRDERLARRPATVDARLVHLRRARDAWPRAVGPWANRPRVRARAAAPPARRWRPSHPTRRRPAPPQSGRPVQPMPPGPNLRPRRLAFLVAPNAWPAATPRSGGPRRAALPSRDAWATRSPVDAQIGRAHV